MYEGVNYYILKSMKNIVTCFDVDRAGLQRMWKLTYYSEGVDNWHQPLFDNNFEVLMEDAEFNECGFIKLKEKKYE